MKYVYVTEGQHGDERYHHHLVINASGAADLETICSLWRYGDVVDVERIADRAYMDVARYITKENAEDNPVGAQMWTRNLEKPTVESTFIDDNETIQPEREEKHNEFGSFVYLKYLLPVELNPFHPRRLTRESALYLYELNKSPLYFGLETDNNFRKSGREKTLDALCCMRK